MFVPTVVAAVIAVALIAPAASNALAIIYHLVMLVFYATAYIAVCIGEIAVCVVLMPFRVVRWLCRRIFRS